MEKSDNADKENLIFVLEMAQKLDLSDFSNGKESNLQEAVALGRQIIEEEEVTEEEIREAEKMLTKEMAGLRLK